MVVIIGVASHPGYGLYFELDRRVAYVGTPNWTHRDKLIQEPELLDCFGREARAVIEAVLSDDGTIAISYFRAGSKHLSFAIGVNSLYQLPALVAYFVEQIKICYGRELDIYVVESSTAEGRITQAVHDALPMVHFCADGADLDAQLVARVAGSR